VSDRQITMSATEEVTASLAREIDDLRGDLMRLSDRVAALEKAAIHPTVVNGGVAANASCDAPVTDEALISVISAAVAAYLGAKPQIRQIRLLGEASWAQQGRVTIQASHALEIRHG
jgi:methylmalonyl-CoA carboxyltransferase 12S subunit